LHILPLLSPLPIKITTTASNSVKYEKDKQSTFTALLHHSMFNNYMVIASRSEKTLSRSVRAIPPFYAMADPKGGVGVNGGSGRGGGGVGISGRFLAEIIGIRRGGLWRER
jgi:hypothetical protein